MNADPHPSERREQLERAQRLARLSRWLRVFVDAWPATVSQAQYRAARRVLEGRRR